MKNTRVCPNCNSENHFIAYTCADCQHYLRDKVVNINIWSEFWSFLETPFESFKRIILAEHKNYLILMLLVILLKLFVNSIIIQTTFEINQEITSDLIPNFLLESGYVISFLILFSLILNKLINIFGIKSKLKNILSILIFSMWPLTFGLAILTSVEYALFGSYFFTFDVSPFEMKPAAAYMLYGLEALIFLSAVIYVFIGMKVQTNSKLFSSVAAALFGGALFAVNTFLPLFPL